MTGRSTWLNVVFGAVFVLAAAAVAWVSRGDLFGDPALAAMVGVWLLAGLALLFVTARGAVPLGRFELTSRTVGPLVHAILGVVLCAFGVGWLLFGAGDARFTVGGLALVVGGSSLLFGVWDVARIGESGNATE